MTTEEHEWFQKEGANARALGRSQFSNPLYNALQMPAATNESIEEWQAKANAWNLGWHAESAMGPDQPPREQT